MAATWSVICHSAAFGGAVAGFVSAAAIDFHAFVTFKRWQDVATYNWSTATFRWFAGAITGALSGAGYGRMIS